MTIVWLIADWFDNLTISPEMGACIGVALVLWYQYQTRDLRK